ncbi:MAG: hypothetical protein CMP76_08005 [Flavobacterium sp.]|uniref:hypothetical protein n=1 Tax=Flavobacterium sp. TaxID=239 RepID=UPI000C4100B2|nr:hypothetical protein [Flavobacterium sp.]MBF03224.1 hypothetical protein [Flavobacterium sp.]|tara:strand:- start:41 stop:409 length:369 start_codon:yes stop_codon:yes gene_type:complete
MENQYIYVEEIRELTVANGTTGSISDEKTESDGTEVVGFVIFHDALTANPSMVNASVEQNGVSISKMQHIDNYRSREAGYDKGFKPCKPFDSGQRIRWEVRSVSNFTSEFKAQLIIVKRKKC